MNSNTENTSGIPSQDEVNSYLDELRESGETNMYGASPYLISEWPALHAERGKLASDMLLEWMRTFAERHATP